MGRAARVSISLPEETLRVADRERRGTGESRSQYFRRALEALLQGKREQEAVSRYVAGYIAEPELPDEGYVDELGRALLEREPWD